MTLKTGTAKAKSKPRTARRIVLRERAGSSAGSSAGDQERAVMHELVAFLRQLAENAEALGLLSDISLTSRIGDGQFPSSEPAPGVQIAWRSSVQHPSADPLARSKAAVENAASHILGLLLDQRRRLHQLTESEALFKVVLHAISDVAILTDDAGAITYVCPNADGFCGRSYDEIRRLPSIFEILPHDSGCFETMRTGQPTRDLKTKLVGKDGCQVTVLTDVVKTGLRQGPYLFTMRDVSRLSESEERLADANARLQTSAQALADKNVALRELLHQAGQEYLEIQTALRTTIDATVLPLVSVLETTATPDQQPILATLREVLNSLVMTRSPKLGPTVNLTSREQKICNMISSGFSTKQIASALNVSPATVANTRKRIRRKLGISGLTDNLATHWHTIQS